MRCSRNASDSNVTLGSPVQFGVADNSRVAPIDLFSSSRMSTATRLRNGGGVCSALRSAACWGHSNSRSSTPSYLFCHMWNVRFLLSRRGVPLACRPCRSAVRKLSHFHSQRPWPHFSLHPLAPRCLPLAHSPACQRMRFPLSTSRCQDKSGRWREALERQVARLAVVGLRCQACSLCLDDAVTVFGLDAFACALSDPPFRGLGALASLCCGSVNVVHGVATCQHSRIAPSSQWFV